MGLEELESSLEELLPLLELELLEEDELSVLVVPPL